MEQKQYIVTNAPSDYDWGWAKTAISQYGYIVNSKNDEVRLVEVTDEYHARMQLGRYQSGLYFAEFQDKFLEDCIKYPKYQKVFKDDLYTFVLMKAEGAYCAQCKHQIVAGTTVVAPTPRVPYKPIWMHIDCWRDRLEEILAKLDEETGRVRAS